MDDRTATTSLLATRRALHGLAELVLAGPQYAATHEIALRVVPRGFSTVAGPEVRVVDGRVEHGSTVVPAGGRTPRELLGELGLTPTSLAEVYSDGSGVTLDETLTLDEAALAQLTAAWSAGDAALRRLDPTQEPVLWPEHFDVGISLDEVNFGVSPGDSAIPVPYAYVGPWQVPPADDFWTESFGAARTVAELGGVDGVLAFFEEGRDRSGR